jgi:hypothetical protein
MSGDKKANQQAGWGGGGGYAEASSQEGDRGNEPE